MSPSIVVAIREDPSKSGRPVEALRIALGLASGENPLTVVLTDKAPSLLAGEEDTVIDGDVLEQYLPSIKHLAIPMIVPEGSIKGMGLDEDFHLREVSPAEIHRLIASADRTLVF